MTNLGPDFGPDAEIERLKADHDAQRRELQARNTELVERCRHAERIVGLLYPATHLCGYFISSVSILAQPRETQDYFAEVLRFAEAQRPPAVKE